MSLTTGGSVWFPISGRSPIKEVCSCSTELDVLFFVVVGGSLGCSELHSVWSYIEAGRIMRFFRLLKPLKLGSTPHTILKCIHFSSLLVPLGHMGLCEYEEDM